MTKNKAPALPDSEPKPISVKKLGRRQRINVEVNKTEKRIKKDKRKMKMKNIINESKKVIFYASQSSLLISGITLLCKPAVRIAMAAPVDFSINIPIYQVSGTILLGMVVYFEFTKRVISKPEEDLA